ncbi:NAD(P)H-dependent oxidoreductase [Mobilitalea sibirica]|uniref:NAD(P)H-dependent oxidoreductase n=1 Tax=Mobilitalea sibirica TaxID=1462919 RepID=A0A8J7KUC1_9FIRM|nr:NAD(P)H-dependent oxidoreductase [Mobilitalea sibirica]MBH1942321.1 NAD(P)H-dependent oxidoreductase [Mobilitalea sibirica]
MKITVINGNTRHGNTWSCMKLFLKELSNYDETEIKEYYLPKDMPYFCIGCYSCFSLGENSCPHHEVVSPIVNSIIEADLIIMTSPVYSLDVSGHLKALLDHLCFLWISHRPIPAMFHKASLAIVTTAGVGLGHTVKTMTNSLSFWGVKRIFTYKAVIPVSSWEQMSEQKRYKMGKKIRKKAGKIARSIKKMDHLHYPMIRKMLFYMMRNMMKSNTWNPFERNYWEKQGWLGKKRPF